MKITFSKGSIDSAPAGYVRVRLTEDSKGTKRYVREGETEWLEIGTGKRAEVTQRHFLIIVRSVIQAAKQAKAHRRNVQPVAFHSAQRAPFSRARLPHRREHGDGGLRVPHL